MTLAITLAARRKTLGISQNDLSEMSGVSLATIKNIERGKGNPSFETVNKILSILGMEMLFKVRSPFDNR
ncbi:MAG: helix-turn-helix transcriptional regulator [Bacteroidales bacterium]|nr:helix-turn-helix transcriptional regulator [Bacteroidales bacterium]